MTDQVRIGGVDDPPAEEGDLPSDAMQLGVDGLGNRHYHSRSDDLIAIVDGETCEVVYSRDDVPAGPAVGGWFDHIQEARGWVETDVAEVLADHLHYALREGRESVGGDDS